jgi:DNA-binding XRE family transcriptional regulator
VENKLAQEVVCGLESSLLAQASEGITMGPIEPSQCRAARALLQWTQKELGLKAKVSDVTIRSFELGMTDPTRATLDVIQRAFEKAGVDFTNDDRPGVRMKRKGRKTK